MKNANHERLETLFMRSLAFLFRPRPPAVVENCCVLLVLETPGSCGVVFYYQCCQLQGDKRFQDEGESYVPPEDCKIVPPSRPDSGVSLLLGLCSRTEKRKNRQEMCMIVAYCKPYQQYAFGGHTAQSISCLSNFISRLLPAQVSADSTQQCTRWL